MHFSVAQCQHCCSTASKGGHPSASGWPCASKLHNRNAACLGYHFSSRSDPKGDSMFCAPRVHKLGPATPRRDLPESVCVPESPTGPVSCLRLLGLCHPHNYSRFVRSMSSSVFIRSDGRITSAADLPFRSLAHRAETALHPGSLLCSGVSSANRTFPPIRPPGLPSATDSPPNRF